MPSFVHEHAIRLLEKHPAVLRELCSWVGIDPPGPMVRLEPEHPELRVDVGKKSDIRQLRPDLFVREWNKAIQRELADSELSPYELWGPDLTAPTGADPSPDADTHPASLVGLWLIDVQASQDETRARAWFLYVVTIAYFYDLEPAFLILALGNSMENWCREQVHQHERLRAEKNVRILGPSMLAGRKPANPHVAAIMAVLYRRAAPLELVEYAVKGLMATGNPEDVDYARMVLLAVNPKIAKKVMTNMERRWEVGEIERESYVYLDALEEGEAKGRVEGRVEGRAEGRVEGRAEGRAEGMALALLTVLRARGLEVSDRLEAALVNCHDLIVLEHLARRATHVAHADELLAELSTQG